MHEDLHASYIIQEELVMECKKENRSALQSVRWKSHQYVALLLLQRHYTFFFSGCTFHNLTTLPELAN